MPFSAPVHMTDLKLWPNPNKQDSFNPAAFDPPFAGAQWILEHRSLVRS